MQFKHTSLPLSEIARKLDVDAVVEGSVLQSGNRVRVTARLVPAASEKPLWAEQYDRDLRDILTVQAEVTQAIAGEIKLTLSPEEKTRLASPRPVNPEAYEAYLKGRSYWFQVSKPGYEEAEHYFRLALEKDPNYALAYSGLADVWLMRTDTGYLAPTEVLDKAKLTPSKLSNLILLWPSPMSASPIFPSTLTTTGPPPKATLGAPSRSTPAAPSLTLCTPMF